MPRLAIVSSAARASHVVRRCLQSHVARRCLPRSHVARRCLPRAHVARRCLREATQHAWQRGGSRCVASLSAHLAHSRVPII
eukprot:4065097-Prymnesium_polylepis.1